MGSTGANRGRGTSSGADTGFNTRGRRLVSKAQVDELTADFTPQQFLGDNLNYWSGTVSGAQDAALLNSPDTLEIGGYTFSKMGAPIGQFDGRDVIVQLDYQSTEQVGTEYPVLQVGIRLRRTPKGRVKSEIIRDGYLYKTKFW